LTEELALNQAKESDSRRRSKATLSELDGIPIALKDVFSTKDIKTTAASKILENYIPPFNATVVKRLFDAGCVLLGKTNTDEFTMGSSTENSAFQITKNPWDLTRVPGGSSGGSAAAVSADLCCFALGTDTGGSIRQPSSFCSTVGLKITYGLVSRYGVISYASSFDTIGPITKNVEDAAIVLKYIAGYDKKDQTSIKKKISDYTAFLNADLKGKRIGIPKEFYGEGLDEEVADILESAKKTLHDLGAEIVDVSMPLTKYAIATYYVLVKSEASSNLSRYDGVRFGHSRIKSENIENLSLEDLYQQTRSQGFGNEAKRSIMMGTYALSSGYYDAYYKKASKVRAKIKQEYQDVLKEVDVLITPVSPFPAFKIGEKLEDPLAMYKADADTVTINTAGVPAMSVPAGFTKNGLPVGMQIIGPRLGEGKIFEIANAFEQKTEWHLKKPNI
jgi:aspartyl-tRNA(Asn)/glutamyl-tRNA(Gln) amidotransferase subunit A